ncbi:MAG: hypothetical protein Phyf2KO_19260 [Phycisphaerales bacterium]
MRSHKMRRAERFATTSLESQVGVVRDVSETGFRLSSRKKMAVSKGEIHEISLRTVEKKLTIRARVQWVRRTCWLPAVYEAGFQIVDSRPGVGAALKQLGLYGFASGKTQIEGESKSEPQPEPTAQEKPEAPRAFIEYEDLYLVLAVERDASSAEIKKAYRQLAQEHHPDHSDAPDAAERFDRIAKAYQVLGDAKKRDWYDKLLNGEVAA